MYRITLTPSNSVATTILMGVASAYPILEAALKAYRDEVRSANIGLSSRPVPSRKLQDLDGPPTRDSDFLSYLMDTPRMLFSADRGRLQVDNVPLTNEQAMELALRIRYQLELCTLYRGTWSISVDQELTPSYTYPGGTTSLHCSAVNLVLPPGIEVPATARQLKPLLQRALWAAAANSSIWNGAPQGALSRPPAIEPSSIHYSVVEHAQPGRPMADIDRAGFEQLIVNDLTFSCEGELHGAMFMGLPDLLVQGRIQPG